MDINHRSLYNSLRMNWVLHPTLEVQSWQVEDYRSLPLDEILERLEDKKIHLSKPSFLAYAETVDSPEELTELLTAGLVSDTQVQDQVYLLIFELWRRFLPEKPSLSIFCDEMDHQIHLYDQGQAVNMEAMQDALANLEMILDENSDQGTDPHNAFQAINAGCAHDLETFLYDFISEQVDNENYSYANELLEGFNNYVVDNKWFTFLRARILAPEDMSSANALIARLIKNCSSDPDLDFSLELLSFLVGAGEAASFQDLVKKTVPLLQTEEDFQNLIAICADFYHRLDFDEKEQSLQDLLNKRISIDLSHPFDRHDPQSKQFLSIVS